MQVDKAYNCQKLGVRMRLATCETQLSQHISQKVEPSCWVTIMVVCAKTDDDVDDAYNAERFLQNVSGTFLENDFVQ